MPPRDQPINPTFRGYLATSKDALIVIQQALNNQFPLTTRRPKDKERSSLIQSGNVFVFIEESSGIKRWTDGISWSPSRILGRFLIYRELDKNNNANNNYINTAGASQQSSRAESSLNDAGNFQQTANTGSSSSSLLSNSSQFNRASLDERLILGSLVGSYAFKENGLIKKSLSITLSEEDSNKINPNANVHNKQTIHLISYYTAEDVLSHILSTPTEMGYATNIEFPFELLDALRKSAIGGTGTSFYQTPSPLSSSSNPHERSQSLSYSSSNNPEGGSTIHESQIVWLEVDGFDENMQEKYLMELKQRINPNPRSSISRQHHLQQQAFQQPQQQQQRYYSQQFQLPQQRVFAQPSSGYVQQQPLSAPQGQHSQQFPQYSFQYTNSASGQQGQPQQQQQQQQQQQYFAPFGRQQPQQASFSSTNSSIDTTSSANISPSMETPKINANYLLSSSSDANYSNYSPYNQLYHTSAQQYNNPMYLPYKQQAQQLVPPSQQQPQHQQQQQQQQQPDQSGQLTPSNTEYGQSSTTPNLRYAAAGQFDTQQTDFTSSNVHALGMSGGSNAAPSSLSFMPPLQPQSQSQAQPQQLQPQSLAMSGMPISMGMPVGVVGMPTVNMSAISGAGMSDLSGVHGVSGVSGALGKTTSSAAYPAQWNTGDNGPSAGNNGK